MTVPAAPNVLDPAVQVFGPALVSVAQTVAGTYYPLGYTRNGVDQTEEAFWLDVPGDQYGGDDGPPIDIQHLGSITRVRCELTKWNVDNIDMVRGRVNAPLVMGEGFISCPYIGSLMIGGGFYYALRIFPGCIPPTGSPYYAYDFPIAIPRPPIEVNHATKFATVVVEFECHRHPTSGYTYLHTYYENA